MNTLAQAQTDLRLDANALDYFLVAFYFVLVLGIGSSPGAPSPPASTSCSPAGRCRRG
jgi:hypothetical protein